MRKIGRKLPSWLPPPTVPISDEKKIVEGSACLGMDITKICRESLLYVILHALEEAEDTLACGYKLTLVSCELRKAIYDLENTHWKRCRFCKNGQLTPLDSAACQACERRACSNCRPIQVPIFQCVCSYHDEAEQVRLCEGCRHPSCVKHYGKCSKCYGNFCGNCELGPMAQCQTCVEGYAI